MSLFEEVDYQWHYRQYAQSFIIDGNSANNLYFEQQAQEMHALTVAQAVDGVTRDALLLLPTTDFAAPAERLFRYGIMRRWRMISASFRDFRSIVSPDRNVPLSQEQADLSCRALNSIYIDIYGLLDNYAWMLVHQSGSENTRAARPMAVSLFSRIFRDDPALATLGNEFEAFVPWVSEFRERRNPAAHRIPLHVPPAALTPRDIAEHERIDRQASEALARGDFGLAAELGEATWRIGSFKPYFVHDPTEAFMPVFPTLPNDIGNAVRIGRIAHDFLRDTAKSA
ncbi:hypothetical protein SAMN05216456_1443 [Devosia crocina]|uniref:Cthe-2314-like HEPN domain-containing protein n=1 Tax=Devosia crocina TaxID=429728 RepID=A0A1I7NAY5_9HYPH|nr:hypothetical protein [Devosia crocina]SFV31743.1 hypothetical protein SAMN05216456_1443 [Devosia crocina]